MPLTYRRALPVLILLAGVELGAGCGSTDEPPTSTSNPAPTTTTDAEPKEPALDASFIEDAGAPTPDPGDQCIDNDDPGSTEHLAKALPDIDDCDSSGPGFGGHPPIVGVLNGTADEDVYRFSGDDTFGCTVNPVLSSPTSGLEICMFVSCTNGSTIFKGCTSGAQKTSDIGNPGCCVTTPGLLQLDFSCDTFTDDSADVFVRVKQTDDLCLPYQFAYHY